ncbi:MAG: hypothetical protein WKG01_15025 [Kofleriaceae bacterium]
MHASRVRRHDHGQLIDSEIAKLELVLHQRWDEVTAAVYADALIARGDTRGELIALDLHVARHGRTSELIRRRTELVSAWLGAEPWRDIDFGFTTTRSPRSRTSSGCSVRLTCACSKSTIIMRCSTSCSARSPRCELPWLHRVALLGRKPASISAATIEALETSASPLAVLGLDGACVLEPPLPASVRTLELTGCEALLGDDEVPHVTAVDLLLSPVYRPAALETMRFRGSPGSRGSTSRATSTRSGSRTRATTRCSRCCGRSRSGGARARAHAAHARAAR